MGGGQNNMASGYASTVVGGSWNSALGAKSLAVGYNASALNAASAVLGFDSSGGSCSSAGIGTVTICADNGLVVNGVDVVSSISNNTRAAQVNADGIASQADAMSSQAQQIEAQRLTIDQLIANVTALQTMLAGLMSATTFAPTSFDTFSDPTLAPCGAGCATAITTASASVTTTAPPTASTAVKTFRPNMTTATTASATASSTSSSLTTASTTAGSDATAATTAATVTIPTDVALTIATTAIAPVSTINSAAPTAPTTSTAGASTPELVVLSSGPNDIDGSQKSVTGSDSADAAQIGPIVGGTAAAIVAIVVVIVVGVVVKNARRSNKVEIQQQDDIPRRRRSSRTQAQTLNFERLMETLKKKGDVDHLSGVDARWKEAICPVDDEALEPLVKRCNELNAALCKKGQTDQGARLAIKLATGYLSQEPGKMVRPLFRRRIDMYTDVLGVNDPHSSTLALRQIVALVKHINKVYRDAYDTVFAVRCLGLESVFAEFTSFCTEVSADLSSDGYYMSQSTNSLTSAFFDAFQMKKKYDAEFQNIADATNGTFQPVPLKNFFRALEKMALRHNPKDRFMSDNVYDILRGALIYETFDDLLLGARAIVDSTRMKILRCKDRFSAGRETASGWRDVMLNGYLVEDLRQHKWEVNRTRSRLYSFADTVSLHCSDS